MFRRVASIVALIAVILAAWTSLQPGPEPRPPYTSGRNNTVLFLTDNANGLSNVHVATTFALLEHHPGVQLHYASFPRLAGEIARVSKAAQVKNAAAKPVVWHELSGPNLGDCVVRFMPSIRTLITPPGAPGIKRLMESMEVFLSPWEAEEHWAVYSQMRDLVNELEPAVVVVDPLFRPAVDLVRTMNRVHAIVSPNALTDSFASKQPWGAMFWKYPVIGSGHPFPVPWSLIPQNIYLQLRFILGVLITPAINAKRAYLIERGVKDPINFIDAHREDVPWLSAAFPEAGLPLPYLPDNVTQCGPIVLDVAPAEEQDAELAAWLKRAPTMLVNLGSTVRYDEPRAIAMAQALVIVFESTDTQVLWKFRRDHDTDYNDDWKKPLEKYIASGRLRLEAWLKVDPVSLLNTGDIVVSVHHGGANSYYETVLSGVPQVVLALWVDLYNFAQAAEYLGIGVWPGQDTAPTWDAESLSQGFLKALTDDSLRQKAKALGEVAKTYGGRDRAAQEIAKLAAAGY